jgi:hypothetical protein
VRRVLYELDEALEALPDFSLLPYFPRVTFNILVAEKLTRRVKARASSTDWR